MTSIKEFGLNSRYLLYILWNTIKDAKRVSQEYFSAISLAEGNTKAPSIKKNLRLKCGLLIVLRIRERKIGPSLPVCFSGRCQMSVCHRILWQLLYNYCFCSAGFVTKWDLNNGYCLGLRQFKGDALK